MLALLILVMLVAGLWNTGSAGKVFVTGALFVAFGLAQIVIYSGELLMLALGISLIVFGGAFAFDGYQNLAHTSKEKAAQGSGQQQVQRAEN